MHVTIKNGLLGAAVLFVLNTKTARNKAEAVLAKLMLRLFPLSPVSPSTRAVLDNKRTV